MSPAPSESTAATGPAAAPAAPGAVARPLVYTRDPKRDLLLERTLDVPKELVWLAWTSPEHLKKWFCPRPWMTTMCEIDLRPGGAFRTTMRGPDGPEMTNDGCYLEVFPNERLTFTSALAPGYRPHPRVADDVPFTAVISMETHGKGTKYSVLALHPTEAIAEAHQKMGFNAGWGTALDQMVEMVKQL